MSRLRFKLDRAGVKAVARQPGVGKLLTSKAEDAADAARAAAPRGTGALGGGYEESIEAKPARLTPDGWVASVESDDIAWHLVEFGSINNAPYRPLTKGVKAAGLDFRDGA